MSCLILEAGRTYVRRDGKIVGPVIWRPDKKVFPFIDPDRLYSYTPEGRYLDSGNESHCDLVREYAPILGNLQLMDDQPVWC